MSVNYIYLIAAILLEVTGTMLLPVSANFTRLWPTLTLAVCYMAAFWLLTFAIRTIPSIDCLCNMERAGRFHYCDFGDIDF